MQSHGTVAVSIDHTLFPHIWAAILAYASNQALFTLRRTAKHVRDQVDKLLVGTHIVIGKRVAGRSQVPGTCDVVLPRGWYKKTHLAEQVRVVDLEKLPDSKKKHRSPNSCNGCFRYSGHTYHRIADVRDIISRLPALRMIRLFNHNCSYVPPTVAREIIVVMDLSLKEADVKIREDPVLRIPWLKSGTDVVLNFRYHPNIPQLFSELLPLRLMCLSTDIPCKVTMLFTRLEHLSPPLIVEPCGYRSQFLDRLCEMIAGTLPRGTIWQLVDTESWPPWIPKRFEDDRFPPAPDPSKRNQIKISTAVLDILGCITPVGKAQRLIQTIQWPSLEEYRNTMTPSTWRLKMGE